MSVSEVGVAADFDCSWLARAAWTGSLAGRLDWPRWPGWLGQLGWQGRTGVRGTETGLGKDFDCSWLASLVDLPER